MLSHLPAHELENRGIDTPIRTGQSANLTMIEPLIGCRYNGPNRDFSAVQMVIQELGDVPQELVVSGTAGIWSSRSVSDTGICSPFSGEIGIGEPLLKNQILYLVDCVYRG